MAFSISSLRKLCVLCVSAMKSFVTRFPVASLVAFEKTNTRRKRKTSERLESEPATPLDPAKARERVFQHAGRLLAAKERSVEELRERLLEGRGATKTAVESVIERLREYGYLNDERF